MTAIARWLLQVTRQRTAVLRLTVVSSRQAEKKVLTFSPVISLRRLPMLPSQNSMA